MQNMINAIYESQTGAGTNEVLTAAENTKGFILHFAGVVSRPNGSNAKILVDDNILLNAFGDQNVNGHSTLSSVLPVPMMFPKNVSLKLNTTNTSDTAWCWYEVIT